MAVGAGNCPLVLIVLSLPAGSPPSHPSFFALFSLTSVACAAQAQLLRRREISSRCLSISACAMRHFAVANASRSFISSSVIRPLARLSIDLNTLSINCPPTYCNVAQQQEYQGWGGGAKALRRW